MTNSDGSDAASQQKAIEKAGKSKNPMEQIPGVAHYVTSSNIEYSFYCKQKADMDLKTLKWAFKLAERNVSQFYKALKMGWQPKIKQNDLNKNWARYFVSLDNTKTPVAYAMFRFDQDYGSSVLYCYELQIEHAVHRQGLGRFIMNALERCAQYWNMDKVILTVLKNNHAALAFFKAMGYILDYSSPDILENAEYEILSKKINKN